jgi:ankyrin repeat protein
MAKGADGKKLIELLRQLEIPRSDPVTTITGAAIVGDAALTAAFLDAGANIEERSVGFASPLQAAANFGHDEVVDLLLKRGADTKKKPDTLRSPLEAAVRHFKIFKRIIDAGGDISAEPDLIIHASMLGCAETLRLLLENEVQSKRAAYALFKAAKGKKYACVRILMDAGAPAKDEVTFKNTLEDARTAKDPILVALLEGQTINLSGIDTGEPRMPAAKPVDETRPAKEQQALELIRGLKGRINEVPAEFDRPPLVIAAMYNLTQIVDALLEAGAELEARDEMGHTALIAAAERGHIAIVKRLIDAGADVNAKSNYHYTALIYAAHRGDLEMVKMLLEAGAKSKAKAKDKRTAHSAACGLHVNEIKRLLEERK